MKTMLTAASVAATTIVFGAAATAGSKPDDGLYSMYHVEDGSMFMSICGHFGCGSGFVAGERVCAVLESTPSLKDGVMTRNIYVLDARNSAKDEMVLSVFRRVDTFDNGFSVTFDRDIALGITGGSKAECKMVGTPKYVILGTDRSSHAVKVSKKTFKVSTVANGPTTLLSVDSRGYTSISDTASGGYRIMDPNAQYLSNGGIAAQQVGSQTATTFK